MVVQDPDPDQLVHLRHRHLLQPALIQHVLAEEEEEGEEEEPRIQNVLPRVAPASMKRRVTDPSLNQF